MTTPSKGMPAKVRAYLKALETGRANYAKADKLLDELQKSMFVNETYDIGAGETAELVDQFALKSKIWKPCGVTRYVIKVAQAKEV